LEKSEGSFITTASLAGVKPSGSSVVGAPWFLLSREHFDFSWADFQ
jgi:hypothetical protein